ncbi:hypothetical protein [Pseudoalteromonas sp. OOF1S-7]|uniref:hypothetical protein n=1 Tax=Pseudoalteromonas sp. OOF1S-7 TaxID=2917757 RepID=UPI001EF3DC3F|nr:hypothetical protein [Pseudoalteromonas sp. OOF1S-7]MCG7537407.1 hypothetical protein [Pseudoalteromonas sp. OOF1S-7]
MQETRKIGESLANKAIWAVLSCCALFAILAVNGGLNIGNVALSAGAGGLSAVLLLAYWHGKGGSFFIFGLGAPLLAIMFSELPDFLSLAWVINSFFSGFALILLLYKLTVLRKQ